MAEIIGTVSDDCLIGTIEDDLIKGLGACAAERSARQS